MKKNLILFLIILGIFSIKNVYAENYYTRTDGGRNIYYCQDDNCKTISSNSSDVKDSGNDVIIDGEKYSYKSDIASNNKTSDDKEDSDDEDDSNSFGDNGPCNRLKSPLKFIGYILLIVKIVIPLLLIIFGVIDLFKAVTGGKDGEITKSLKTFIFRLIAGVAIFFIPTIISFIFSLVDGFDSVESEFNICQKCILNVSQCK